MVPVSIDRVYGQVPLSLLVKSGAIMHEVPNTQYKCQIMMLAVSVYLATTASAGTGRVANAMAAKSRAMSRVAAGRAASNAAFCIDLIVSGDESHELIVSAITVGDEL
jgi:hypothetical protein